MTSTLPRRDAVIDLLAAQKRAMHVNEIATRLGVAEGSYAALHRLLDDLSFDASIVALPGQRFRLGKQQVERRGKEVEGVLGVNPRGFGFVNAAGLDEDVFIPGESMGGAMHGDRVRARIVTRSRRGVEGEVLEVLARGRSRVAGTLAVRGKSAWIEPDDTRVRGPIVLAGQSVLDLKGKDGDAAVASITRYPSRADENPEGKLEAVLGRPGDPEVEVAKILVREGIEEAHPADAIAEARAFGEQVAADALLGREDLTSIPLPTIDPEDARDHDDAVWVVRHDDGSYTAWIAIADVSHYVKAGTALDASALTRGTSIYLPDRAIPMLPRELSSNLCSLLPDVVRLCLCVIVDLDATGTPGRSRVVEGYLRSAAKLTYPGVARALGFTPEPERSEAAEAMRADLQIMWELAGLLRARRMRRGALDFDLPEAKVVLDASGKAPLDVEKRSRDPGVAKAYQLIEELMLLGNETVARFLVDRGAPAIFRNHGAPDEAKLARFATMASELGVPFELDDALEPKKLSALLKKIANHPQKHVFHMLLLRAMKQAVYDVANIGHFGLASSAYLHFTSPIRRYPDLVVHRAVRAVLRGERVDTSEGAIERLRTAATTASDTERRAMDVEREVVDLHRAIVMKAHVGEIFEGTVTGFVGTGVFVNLEKPFVDVLVRMEALGPDDYAIDDEGLRVIGRKSGDRIALGDKMLVVIEDVSILRRTTYGRRMFDPEERKARKKVAKADRAAGKGERVVKKSKGTRAPSGGKKLKKRR